MRGGSAFRFWQPAPQVATELVGAYLEASTGALHVHEEWQFGVLETPARLTIGAYRRYGAGPDDVTIVRPYEVHSEDGSGGVRPVWRVLYVAPSIVSRVHGGLSPRVWGPVVTDPTAAAELRSLLGLSCDGAISGSEFLSRLMPWLEQFLLHHVDDAVAPRRAPAVERARAYLQNRPTESVSLTQIGATSGVSLSYLVRSFSQSVGLPPKSYHAQVRLARARRLLAQGKSATWVAYECGFADQSHLGRRFKECYGITPRGFQAQWCSRGNGVGAVESTAA
jgi:AraC-like DNA-binding protein